MCTVSLLPLPEGFRLVSNRDELRTRPAALPPRRHDAGRCHALMPSDPLGGGTWIGVNDAGIAATLLNASDPYLPQDPISRGSIVVTALAEADLATARALVDTLDWPRMRPCRLILASTGTIWERRWDGRLGSWRSLPWEATMWTSSALGDGLVEGPRRQLFESYVRSGWHVSHQDAFHAHRWLEDGSISVCMQRADACTVSRTVIEVEGGRATCSYLAEPLHDEGVQPVTLGMPVVES